MKSGVFLLTLVAVATILDSCSPATGNTPTPPAPEVETQISAASLVGAWSDDYTSQYSGGGTVRKARQFEFFANGKVTLSIQVDDRPPLGTTLTYAEYHGTFQLDGNTVTVLADRYRKQATPFVSADQRWVTPVAPLAVYSSPAMIWGGHLYWDPDNPVWTPIAPTELNEYLRLQTFTQDVGRALERQTSQFYPGVELTDIDTRNSDGQWSNDILLAITYTDKSDEPFDTSVSPPEIRSPGLVSGNRYLFDRNRYAQRR